MNDLRDNPEEVLVRRLRGRDFALEAGPGPGDYVVTACGDLDLPLRPRLSVPNEVLSEYLVAMSRDHQEEPDPLLEALDLVEVHVEEQLAKVDPDGRNHAKELGVRRGADGRPEWFVEREEPDLRTPPGAPSADLVWRAERPET